MACNTAVRHRVSLRRAGRGAAGKPGRRAKAHTDDEQRAAEEEREPRDMEQEQHRAEDGVVQYISTCIAILVWRTRDPGGSPFRLPLGRTIPIVAATPPARGRSRS